MFKAKIKVLIIISGLLIFTLPFIGSDCNSENNPPAPTTGVTPPQNVSVVLTSDTTGQQSAAVISWAASPDESMNNFYGYRLVTYRLDNNGNIISTLENDSIPKVTHSFTIGPIGTRVKFQSFIFSQLDNGTESDSAGTVIYAGVFYRTDGTIDEYQQGDSTVIKSGYGWNTVTGNGMNLFFDTENAANIDINLRAGEGDSLTFFSPSVFSPGIKSAKLMRIGTGEEAFSETILPEPTADSVRVDTNNVYLIKTQEGYYIKLWVKSIHYVAGSIPPFYNITFDYKLQPIAEFRLL